MKWAVLGAVELKSRGQTVAMIQVFSSPTGSGSIRIDDVHYLGFEQESFRSIIGRSKPKDSVRAELEEQ